MRWITCKKCGAQIRGHFASDWTAFFVIGIVWAALSWRLL
jgi:uncharacterized protein (DUF983 family)